MIDLSNLFLRFVAFLTILLSALIIGRVFGKIIYMVLSEFEVNKNLRRKGLKFPLEEIISLSFRYIVYLIGFIIALNQLNLFGLFLKIILITLGTFTLIFIVLSLKNIIPNYVYGLSLKNEDIKVKGKIISKDRFSIKTKDKNGDIVSIPYYFLKKNNKL